MKTFRQEIRNWLKEQKLSETNTDRNNLLEEIIVKINELEKIEESSINFAYYKGHMDGESKKIPKHNYYKTTHKSNSLFRQIVKN